MKINSGFMLREVAGEWVVVPLGERVVEFNAIMTLSESGALLWKEMEHKDVEKDDLVDIMLSEYDIDRDTATRDIQVFISDIKDKGILI